MLDTTFEQIANLQKKRGRSRQDFFDYQFAGAQAESKEFFELTGEGGRKILDIGCGTAGRSAFFASEGFDVTAADNFSYDCKLFEVARAVAAERCLRLRFCVADAHQLPFRAAVFDIIRLDSVIEHCRDPESVLAECYRISKPGGLIFVNFPLFYSAFGGHIFDYIKMPWFHILPSSWVCKAIRACRSRPGFISTDYVEKLYLSLNRMTLKRYENSVAKLGFTEIAYEEKFYMPHDACLFVDRIKEAWRNRSWIQLRRSFRSWRVSTFLIFCLLHLLYRMPFFSGAIFREAIVSGVRSVLQRPQAEV